MLRHGAQLGFDMVEILKLVLRLVEPGSIGLRTRKLGLELGILDDAALFEVDQQHLAGLQAPFAGDVFLGKGQHPAFRGHADEIIAGHAEARGPEAVAVERSADLATIGKGDCGGTVPRLHQRGMVFVEGAQRRVHQIVLAPGFGHQHHHGVGKAVTAQQQQFERIVEAGGVRLAMRHDRPQFVEIRAQKRRFHRPAARVHPVDVAAHGVDFAIMGDQAIWVRQPPAGEGIGRKALMHQPHRRYAIGIAQVIVERADLRRQQ